MFGGQSEEESYDGGVGRSSLAVQECLYIKGERGASEDGDNKVVSDKEGETEDENSSCEDELQGSTSEEGE